MTPFVKIERRHLLLESVLSYLTHIFLLFMM